MLMDIIWNVLVVLVDQFKLIDMPASKVVKHIEKIGFQMSVLILKYVTALKVIFGGIVRFFFHA